MGGKTHFRAVLTICSASQSAPAVLWLAAGVADVAAAGRLLQGVMHLLHLQQHQTQMPMLSPTWDNLGARKNNVTQA